jgi:hypothetical protein
LEFALLLGRHSSATLSDCQRLLRLAATLNRLNGDEEQAAKKIRVQRKITAICAGFNSEALFYRSGAIELKTNNGLVRLPE